MIALLVAAAVALAFALCVWAASHRWATGWRDGETFRIRVAWWTAPVVALWLAWLTRTPRAVRVSVELSAPLFRGAPPECAPRAP